jgi:hypothetical protein
MTSETPSSARITLSVYRTNYSSLPDIPDAWEAHRERARVLAESLSDSGFTIVDAGAFNDQERTHEFAEAILEIFKDPTTHIALGAAAVYVLKVLSKPLDSAIEKGVGHLFDKLHAAFGKKRIGQFWITLPDGQRINVESDAEVQVTLRDGKVKHLQVNAIPGQRTGP